MAAFFRHVRVDRRDWNELYGRAVALIGPYKKQKKKQSLWRARSGNVYGFMRKVTGRCFLTGKPAPSA